MIKNSIQFTFIFLILIYTSNIKTFAANNQENSDSIPGFVYFPKLNPLLMAVNGLAVELEVITKKRNLAYFGGMEFYSGQFSNDQSINSPNKSGDISGFGIDCGAKYYVPKFLFGKDMFFNDRNFYFSAGLNYTHVNTSYTAETMVNSKDQNGNPIITYVNNNQNNSINTYRFNFNIGAAVQLSDAAYLDAYVGVGMRGFSMKSDYNEEVAFKDNVFANKGNYFSAGIKIGLCIW